MRMERALRVVGEFRPGLDDHGLLAGECGAQVWCESDELAGLCVDDARAWERENVVLEARAMSAVSASEAALRVALPLEAEPLALTSSEIDLPRAPVRLPF
jgi:hypothetical protein